MSIQDAIEQAKQLQLSRSYEQAARAVPVAAPQVPASAPQVTRGAPRTLGNVDLVFPLLPLDLEQCFHSRILLGGDESGVNAGAAAAYRMVRTRILQRTRSRGWTALGVTSPGASEGKSTTALNLALAIAREKNNNVFLLDLDMRNPSVCSHLGVKPEHELLDFFKSNVAPDKIFFNIGIDGLALAGSTRGTTDASELLATSKLEELLAYVRSICPTPMIVVDLPPVLSTDDALIVGPKLDATLMVITEGKTRRDGIQQAIDHMSEFNVAGIILNRSSQGVSDYYTEQGASG
jgi:Mrp family chromosome partitioning ATPase